VLLALALLLPLPTVTREAPVPVEQPRARCSPRNLVAWSFSMRGRRLVLSVLGYYYLRHSQSRPPEGHVFTLADGRQATITRTELLHGVMDPAGGADAVLVPNATLMEQYYNWAAGEARPGAGDGPA